MPTLGARQQAALAALAAAANRSPSARCGKHGVDLGTLRRLAARGFVHLHEQVSERDPFAGGAAPIVDRDEARALTDEQATALTTLTALLDSGAYHAALVHGVTGSGKTELYVRLARHAIAQGRRVLILVPEIALTPQVASQFRAAFGDRVAIQHSGLADGERHDQWYRIRRGEVDLVVGTRSAVFAPLDRLGLIVVDEEHDGSYKQEETPRYNGRDVAVVRAREARALVVLGSATPAMETCFNAAAGRYQPRRACRGACSIGRWPAFGSSICGRSTRPSGPDVVLSAALTDAVGARLSAGEQTLLLLNRRGYATSVLCRQCGHILECPNCSVTLTVHRRSARAVARACATTATTRCACRAPA